MRNSKKIMSFSSGDWVKCVWCAMHNQDNPGYELYKSVFHEHADWLSCDHPMANHVNFVFCSERHKQYYLNSHIDMGNLPDGFKSRL